MRYKPIFLALIVPLVVNAEPAEPLAVTVASMQDIVIYPNLTLPAKTLALNDSQLASQLSATVEEIVVSVGEHVEAGALLVTLDDREYRIALEQAEAGLRNVSARLELARYRLSKVDALLSRNSISEDDAKQRSTEAASLESERDVQAAAVERAKLDVSRCRLRAPFAGVITDRLASVGEWVAPGTPLVRLVSDQELELSVQVQLSDVDDLSGAAELAYRSGDRIYPVRLRSITGVVGEADRMREARLSFTAQTPLPGQSGELVFLTPFPHLPASVLVRRGASIGFFEAVASTAHFRPLAGIVEGQPARVEHVAGRSVVVDGRRKLQDGAPIVVAE